MDNNAMLLTASETRKLLISANLSVDEQTYFLYLPMQLYEHGGRWFESLLTKIPLGGQYGTFGFKDRVCRGKQIL